MAEAFFDNGESTSNVCKVFFGEAKASRQVADGGRKVVETFIKHGKPLAKGVAAWRVIGVQAGRGPELKIVVVFRGVPVHVGSRAVNIETRYCLMEAENMRIQTVFSSDKNALHVGRKARMVGRAGFEPAALQRLSSSAHKKGLGITEAFHRSLLLRWRLVVFFLCGLRVRLGVTLSREFAGTRISIAGRTLGSARTFLASHR
jgi:hypothetical protein